MNHFMTWISAASEQVIIKLGNKKEANRKELVALEKTPLADKIFPVVWELIAFGGVNERSDNLCVLQGSKNTSLSMAAMNIEIRLINK